MKELKAVKVIEEAKAQYLIDRQIYGVRPNKKDLEDFDEALAELQELTQEKSCNGCKHLNDEGMCELCAPCKRYIKDNYTPKG